MIRVIRRRTGQNTHELYFPEGEPDLFLSNRGVGFAEFHQPLDGVEGPFEPLTDTGRDVVRALMPPSGQDKGKIEAVVPKVGPILEITRCPGVYWTQVYEFVNPALARALDDDEIDIRTTEPALAYA